MREFRNELLNYLMSHSGFVSLSALKDKYCPNPPVFKLEDQESFIKPRLNMNHILRELKAMGWIDTTGEFGTGTGYPNIEGMRYFILDPEVKARLTTKGEIEYKKSKEGNKPTIQVGDNFSGILSTGDVTHSPVAHASGSGSKAQASSNIPKIKKGKPSKKLLAVMAAILTLIVAALKIFGVI